jgi:hypothetical protein
VQSRYLLFYFLEAALRDAIIVLNWNVMSADPRTVVLHSHARLIVGL